MIKFSRSPLTNLEPLSCHDHFVSPSIGVRAPSDLVGGGGGGGGVTFLPEKLPNARVRDSYNWDTNALRANCMENKNVS